MRLQQADQAPELWPVTRLEDICVRFTTGGTPSRRKSNFYERPGIPWVKTGELLDYPIYDTKEHISEEGLTASSAKLLPKDTILMAMYGATVGQLGLLRRPMACNQACAAMVIDGSKSTSRFVYYLLRSQRDQIKRSAIGAAQQNLSAGRIKDYEFRLPPINEQREIAATLGALDDKIELNRKTAATLEAMARALYRSWFVDFDPVHAKAEGRTPAHMDATTAALFPKRFGEDGLPDGWGMQPLLDIVELISGGTPKTSEPQFWDGNIPWASAKDVSQCGQAFLIATERAITPDGLSRSSTKIIPRFSTVVVARGATTGRACMFGDEIAMNQTCYALKSRRDQPFFANCMFMKEVLGITLSAHGSVFDTITTKTLERSSVIVPEFRVSAAFEALVSPMFERALALTYENQTLATLRDTLLPRLMSGELRVGAAREQIWDAV